MVADGPAEKILTNNALLEEASILPPQVTQLFWKINMADLGEEVIDVYEASEILAKVLKGKRGVSK